jgi:excisionase family DNA binding protein
MLTYGNFEINIESEKLPDILTLKQACEVLNVHPNTLRQWDAKGILKAVRFGTRKDRRFHKKDVLKLLEKEKR